jgi:sarcosine oxidase subunit alpha
MTTLSHRLTEGGLIDRASARAFTFDGRALNGHTGDTLASALLANGVTLVGRSFKYHRPRGILTAGFEEPNALVELRNGARREPNTRATVAELYEGLVATSQNRWPSLDFDLMAVNGLLSNLFVAGFYYKTFMAPGAAWEKLFEPLIRRAAGLGRLAKTEDPDIYEKAHAFCDLLVVGSGPAGLSAALAAGRAGARVILAEQDFLIGGRLNAERLEVDGKPGHVYANDAAAELASLPNVRVMTRTSVVSVQDGGVYGALERVADHLPAPPPFQPRQRFWRVVAKHCLVATGAIERGIAFGNNDRPGVMMASALRTYLNRFAVRPGASVAVFTATDDGWRTAADLRSVGVDIAVVIDPRKEVALAVRALAGNAPIMTGASVVGTKGGKRLTGVVVQDATGHRRAIEADTLAMSGGYNPDLGLTCHLGHRPVWSDTHAAFLPGATLPPGLAVAGAVVGQMTTADAMSAGRATVAAFGYIRATQVAVSLPDEPASLEPFWSVENPVGKAFVDFQHDVTIDDIALAHREGYRSVEHLKRYTTLGMATDQGKSMAVVGQALMAKARGLSMPEAGTVIFRPPHVPVAIAAYAGTHRGRDFRPTRLTPSHEVAAARGAVFVETGYWLRAQWFPQPGETDWLQSVNREVTATRTHCGICDVSTLGKVEVHGPDAGRLFDFVYCNTLSTLSVGRARYGLMLREDGFVMDDGTVARLAPDRWIVSTTTANAAKVMQHLEFCYQVLMPTLDIQMASVTEAWAQVSVAGPAARSVLASVLDGFDLDNAAFPYMACAETSARGGVPARLFRVSFSGELAYEIAVPAGHGHDLFARLVEAGATPYGTEALGVMRIEKGHPAGNELNGQTVARDLGFGKLMSAKKDYVGRRMAERPALVDPARPTLVGLVPLDTSMRLRAGAHFLRVGAAALAANDEGYLTSVAFSPSLGTWIGLGLLANGPARQGETIRAWDPLRGGDVACRVVPPVFLDPEGVRLRA